MNIAKKHKKRKIAAITSSRSDYAHLRWLLHDLARDPRFDLQVIALGAHLSPEFGRSSRQLEIDRVENVTVVECMLSSDSDVGMAKTLGLATLGLADVLGNMRPDIVLLIADRYEMLAPACVALTLRIPIAHIEGGEITSGAIDDAVRNAITKMAHLHFACTRQAERRIVAMGEEKWRVTWSGSLSLDELRRARLLSKKAVEKRLGVLLTSDTIFAIYHPVTLMQDTVAEARELWAALEQVQEPIIFIFPNADAGSRKLMRMLEDFVAKHASASFFVNLDHITYLSLLKHVSVLVGNSSSGMIESTALNIPTLNVGIRQRGREHAANVIDVAAKRKDILRELKFATSEKFRCACRGLDNPYGDGNAVERIVKVLAEAPLGDELLQKEQRSF